MKKLVLLFLIIIHSSLFINICKAQWISQSIPVNEPILGIEFVDDNTGWAISYSTLTSDTAYILGTTNGGENWNIQFRGDVGLYCLDAIDNNICYAGGADTNGFSIFLKTTNGGLNWEKMNVNSLLIMTEMFFVNKDTGYACDEFFGGLKLTTDAGSTWLNRENGISAFPRTLFFLNYDTGFCGGGFKLFKTTNAGINWGELFQFGEQVIDVQFNDINLGWAALTGNKVGITSNGGLNWVYSTPNTIGSETIPKINYNSDSILWAGSGFRRVYKSNNNGYSWIIQTDSSGSYAMDFTNNLTGWSGYAYESISKTTNGGLTFIRGINNEIPNSFILYQNYPNPFNPSTKIRFTITQNSDVVISIFDILGREIFKWISNGGLQSGTYEYNFLGENLSGGVYIYKLTAKSGNTVYSDSKKMIFLK